MPLTRLERNECERLVEWGFEEDLQDQGDITSLATIPESAEGAALVRCRQAGVVAGLPVLDVIERRYQGALRFTDVALDGPVEEDAVVARIEGRLRAILEAERLMLNVLGVLSGVATLTARYVAAVRGTDAKICDTRKTLPGWRRLQKYAVRVGGGTNHRLGLFDAFLVKDNHLAALSHESEHSIQIAVERARAARKGDFIVEVEVDSLTQLEDALTAGPDIVLLDNMPVENVSLAVEIRQMKAPEVLLEASGGVSLETVGAIARTGVDRISVGALTHSARWLDLGLDFDESPRAVTGPARA